MPGPRGLYKEGGNKLPGIVRINGRFQTAGAGAPTVVQGAGFTVSAPTAGKYTITFRDGAWPATRGFFVNIEDDTLNSTVGARAGAISSANGTCTICTSSSAGTDANLTGPVVSFEVVIRNTSVGQ